MKIFFLSIAFLFVLSLAYAQDDGDGTVRTYQVDHTNKSGTPQKPDSISLQIDGINAYYQKMFKVDSSAKISTIYLRALQFMAAKNFQQTYGYDQEGKLIFTTTQDLNPTNDDNDQVGVYTVQFATIIDIKKGRYRVTISSVTFYFPSENGNRRMTLFDLHRKEFNGESRRIMKNAKGVVDSFERYLINLTNELYTEVEHKAAIYDSKF